MPNSHPSSPTPIAGAPQTLWKSIRGVCLDIDETLSTRGKLTPSAFQSLWDLKNAGFAVVPITGRPAGWCDHIARFWPVDAIVGENGAFHMRFVGSALRLFDTPDPSGLTAQSAQQKLDTLAGDIRREFTGARWASDQSYRRRDLAVDFCEDVAPWPTERVQDLVKLCTRAGAHAKVSSIHVNVWFGEFDKLSGFQSLLKSVPDLPQSIDHWVFIGDSPNDQPMFKAFPISVGVANLQSFIDRGLILNPPKLITRSESGAGFTEFAQTVINGRNFGKT